MDEHEIDEEALDEAIGKAVEETDLPPTQKDEQQFINIPSPITPINPIKLPE